MNNSQNLGYINNSQSGQFSGGIPTAYSTGSLPLNTQGLPASYPTQ